MIKLIERQANSKLLEHLAFAVLMSCFVLQVWESMDKFLSGKTTTTIRTKSNDDEGMLLPNVILCPGYRPHLSEDFVNRDVHPWPINTFYDSYPELRGNEQAYLLMIPVQTSLLIGTSILGHNVSQKMAEQWWNNITYNLTDIVKSVQVKAVAGKFKIDMAKKIEYQKNDAVVIDELSSSQGKCYIFKPSVKFKVSTTSTFDKIHVYISIDYLPVS